jgi:hypothetical protein
MPFAHRVQLAHNCQLIVIFKGGPSLAHRRVSSPVVLMKWALLRLSPLLLSSPSPLISLTCPSIAHCILLGSHSSTILADIYFFNCRWSKGDDFVIMLLGFVALVPPPAIFLLSVHLPCPPFHCLLRPPGSPLSVDCHFKGPLERALLGGVSEWPIYKTNSFVPTTIWMSQRY